MQAQLRNLKSFRPHACVNAARASQNFTSNSSMLWPQVLEGKLEAKGVSSKELAPLTIDSTTEWTYARHVPSPTRRSSRDPNASGHTLPPILGNSCAYIMMNLESLVWTLQLRVPHTNVSKALCNPCFNSSFGGPSSNIENPPTPPSLLRAPPPGSS